MNAYTKKKAARLAWTTQMKAGNVNRADGSWARAQGTGSMPRDMVNGASHRKVS